MLHPSCISRLEEYLLSKNGNNILSQIQNLIALDLSEDKELRMIDIDNGQRKATNVEVGFKDCRILTMVYKDFRTYPDNIYSVDFCTEDNASPCSLFLMGNNGTGKSTMYSALEILYLGYSTYANKMCPSNPDRYLTYAFGTNRGENRKWELSIETVDGNGEQRKVSQEDKRPLSVSSFFCSDYDVQELYNSGGNLYEWILKQMGYGELLDKHRKIDQLKLDYQIRQSGGSRLTKEEYKAILKELLNIKSIDDTLEEVKMVQSEKSIYDLSQNKEFVAKMFTEYWDQLRAVPSSSTQEVDPLLQIAHNDNQSSDEIIKKLLSLYKKIYDVIPKEDIGEEKRISVIEKWIRDNTKFDNDRSETENQIAENILLLEKIQAFLDDFERNVVFEFITTFKQNIEKILEDFSDHNEKFEFEKCKLENIQSLTLNIKYTLGNESFTASPQEYLNAFRFKLFCLTLKLTVSFQWMKTHKTSCPIVIDDIFNASDFENSVRLEYYAHFVKRMYRDNVLSEGFQTDLQLILLTHDDIVFNSFKQSYEAPLLDDFSKNELCKDKFGLISGRLIPVEKLKANNVNNVYFKFKYL